MHDFKIVEQGAPLKEAKKALLLLHGRGATATNILSLSSFFVTRDWYVTAPQATNNTWYPYSFMFPRTQNEPWLGSAIEIVSRLVEKMLEQLEPENLYLGGFSQGACLTAEFVARNPMKYGGVMIFTGGLIGRELETQDYRGDLSGTKIYMTNGDDDPHVPLARSEATRDLLLSMGAEVELDVFPGRPHTILEEEINQAKKLLFHST